MRKPWRDLSKTLREVNEQHPGTYYAPRLKPRILFWRAHHNQAIVGWDANGSICGYGALWSGKPSGPNGRIWLEGGTFWFPGANGGLADRVRGVFALAPPNASLFLVTKHPRVMDVVRDMGFHAVTIQSFEDDLLAWAKDTGMTARLPVSVYSELSEPVPGDRWLFVRR